MPDRCACDVCEILLGRHDPRSPDGYCSFCAERCFPPGDMGGRVVRVAMNKASRTQLHESLRRAQQLPMEARKAMENARSEVADAAVRIAVPLIEQGGKKLVEMIRKKLSGSK